MNTDLEKALDECLSAPNPLAAAKRYPELEKDLLPLLRAARLVREAPQAIPDPGARATGRQRLLEAVIFKGQARRASLQMEVAA